MVLEFGIKENIYPNFVQTATSKMRFTTEVAQALEHLEIILAHSQADQLIEQLTTEIEVFLELGEYLQFSEWIAIAQTTLASLQASPQVAQTLGRLALTGLRAAYEENLKSDRTHTSTYPLKLATSKLLVWANSCTILILKSDSVEEMLIPEADQIIDSRQKRFLHWRQQMIPTYQISELLNYTNPLLETTFKQDSTVICESKNQPEPMLVISKGQQILALEPEMEYLITEPELVIKPLGIDIELPSYICGCTFWKDRLFQVIDVNTLLSQIINYTAKFSNLPGKAIFSKALADNKITSAMAKLKQATILVVDDSKSVRHLISLTLQKVGYKVLLAQDGKEAIAKLQQNPRIQLVICDIEMPNMNGFEFLNHRLQNILLAKIPVVMLSTCSTNKYRQLAMQLGATNYFTKPYIEQEFLAALNVIVS
ncbi:MAG: response regulator [Pelatocladus maniniholoensis HA4357-MV3]|jgi:CheY-like chemotaxis protein|uniref:Response regulator n=1 Tax=Pelatocladus maniniholoensis HA4357-MV3 TaxID=1117104 RepID=A0A9E3LV55_9NOST|nr:response regulator [Pelatocladus maniniholoensis HA4357-MV3]BAZ67859.1 CheA-like two-component hybrid sensor and regulator [Fischerella sp. NIES-4106]